LSFLRRSSTICHSSATATDASAPSLAGKTVFFGNNGAVNGRSACLDDSGHDTPAEHFVSSGITNPCDCGISYKEFAGDRNGVAKFNKSCRHGNSDCRIRYDEFAAGRNGLATFIEPYRRGDLD
jgi:hypothetical protein